MNISSKFLRLHNFFNRNPNIPAKIFEALRGSATELKTHQLRSMAHAAFFGPPPYLARQNRSHSEGNAALKGVFAFSLAATLSVYIFM
jgi:hypothetical protein